MQINVVPVSQKISLKLHKCECKEMERVAWDLASSGFNEQAMAQVLGNVTYTEVVVSSAGLAALSAQT